jgi:SapC
VIPSLLYRQIEPLDRQRHRALRARPMADWSPAREMNALFLTVAEFAEACKEYAIVFVRAGQDARGREQIAPVALTGLKQGENLYLRADGGWDARYVPAFLRRYPFALAQTKDDAGQVLVIDAQWAGWSAAAASEAEPLFDAAGEPTPYLTRVRAFLDEFRRETERTGVFGERLLELGLLQEMRFDATLPSGEKLVVDGFLALDTKKFAELPDALLGELHRSGVLGLLHLQQASLGNMQRLVERRVATARDT